MSEQGTPTVSSITAKAESGHTMIIERVPTMTQGNKSNMNQNMDDKSGNV